MPPVLVLLEAHESIHQILTFELNFRFDYGHLIYNRVPIWHIAPRLQSRTGAGDSSASSFTL